MSCDTQRAIYPHTFYDCAPLYNTLVGYQNQKPINGKVFAYLNKGALTFSIPMVPDIPCRLRRLFIYIPNFSWKIQEYPLLNIQGPVYSDGVYLGEESIRYIPDASQKNEFDLIQVDTKNQLISGKIELNLVQRGDTQNKIHWVSIPFTNIVVQ